MNEQKLTIDGKEIIFSSDDKNLVDLATRSKIGIPAPCYHANRAKGCCNACIVEIDGEQKLACTIAPQAGMTVVVNREDLKQLRKERLAEYTDGTPNSGSCCCPSKKGSCC